MRNKIDIEEVITYSYCPMLYKYIYIDKKVDKKTTIQREFEYSFKKTVFGFLASCADNDTTFNSIKIIWGRIWIKKKKTIEYIYSDPKSWRNTHNEFRKTGISTLKSFYDYFVLTSMFPILFNKKYNVNVGNITLTGRFDVICEIDKQIKILSIKANSKKADYLVISKDMNVTAMSYAFNEIFNIKEDCILIFNSQKGNVTETTRDEKEYTQLKNTVTSVYKCIHNNIFYMCVDDRCNHCSCKKICSK